MEHNEVYALASAYASVRETMELAQKLAAPSVGPLTERQRVLVAQLAALGPLFDFALSVRDRIRRQPFVVGARRLASQLCVDTALVEDPIVTAQLAQRALVTTAAATTEALRAVSAALRAIGERGQMTPQHDREVTGGLTRALAQAQAFVDVFADDGESARQLAPTAEEMVTRVRVASAGAKEALVAEARAVMTARPVATGHGAGAPVACEDGLPADFLVGVAVTARGLGRA